MPVIHTERMSRALEKVGRPAQTVLLPDADHCFARTPDRVQLLSAIESFLAVNLK